MDPVEIQTTITLSRIAAGEIPFGVAVERTAPGTVDVYGKGTNVLENGENAWTPVSTVVATNEAVGVDGATCVKLVTGAVTGSLAYAPYGVAKNLSGDPYIAVLIKSSIVQTTLSIGVSEAANFGSPVLAVLPTLIADEWMYAQVAYPAGTELDRDAVLSVGISRTGTGASNIFIQMVNSNDAIAYDIAGIVKNDEARDDNISKEYDDLTILAAGHANPVPVDGFTCQAEEKVYFVPGTGKITKTKITSNVSIRTGMTTEDQTVAGKQTGVRF